jgi:hypothetical protein
MLFPTRELKLALLPFLILQNTLVLYAAPSLALKELCILPTEYIYVYHVILTNNSTVLFVYSD